MSKAAIIELENHRAMLGTRAVELAHQLDKQKEEFEAEILRLKGIIAAQAETIKDLQEPKAES